MTHQSIRSKSAATALSAVLVLGSTSAFAQEAPPLDSPESITTAPKVKLPEEAAPAIVVPPLALPATQATADPAGVEDTPEPVETPAQAAPATRSTGPARTRIATPPANPSVINAVPPPVTGEMLSSPMPSADAVLTPTAPVVEPPPTEPASESNEAVAGLVALLGLVALGGAGFLLMRRRNSAVETLPEMQLTDAQAVKPDMMELGRSVHVSPAPQTVPPARAPAATPVPVRPTPKRLDTKGKPVSPFVFNPIYQGKRPEERPLFMMPFGPVPTGEARTALLNRMVASRPDAANPFTSPKWRMRRARTMLMKREKMLREQATRPFDFRDFSTHVAIKPYRPAKTAKPHMA